MICQGHTYKVNKRSTNGYIRVKHLSLAYCVSPYFGLAYLRIALFCTCVLRIALFWTCVLRIALFWTCELRIALFWTCVLRIALFWTCVLRTAKTTSFGVTIYKCKNTLGVEKSYLFPLTRPTLIFHADPKVFFSSISEKNPN